VAVITFVSAPSLAGQRGSARSQEEVARDLRSYDRDVVARALDHVPLAYDPYDELGWRFPPSYVVTPGLSAALISALDREAKLHMDGCTVTGTGGRHPELALDLLHYVIALRDSAAIPALVQMICSGGGVRQALMNLGPEIIPHVVEWAGSPKATWADITSSLRALSEAVVRWGETLSVDARASIRNVALQHLEHRGPATKRFANTWEGGFVIDQAITLASVIRAPDLLEVLADIAEGGHEALDGMDSAAAAGLRDMARRGLADSLLRIEHR